jgi:hypothetical protein
MKAVIGAASIWSWVGDHSGAATAMLVLLRHVVG